mgnify:CR=1 FL=1
MSGKPKDYTKMRIGKLVVQEPTKHKDNAGRVIWKCLCDCGEERLAAPSNLLHIEAEGWDISCFTCNPPKLDEYNRGLNKVLAQYKYGAHTRGLEFNLSRDEFELLCRSRCHYCGSLPNRSRDAFEYNGIDRKNNDEGYSRHNVVTCCFICNKAKGTSDYNEFLLWILRVAVKRFKGYKPEDLEIKIRHDLLSLLESITGKEDTDVILD